jgi:hypothetical protein
VTAATDARFVIQKHAASTLHYDFRLEVEKLTGGWTLQRTDDGRQPQWLLIKRRDEFADAARDPDAAEPESIKTGRTTEELSS